MPLKVRTWRRPFRCPFRRAFWYALKRPPSYNHPPCRKPVKSHIACRHIFRGAHLKGSARCPTLSSAASSTQLCLHLQRQHTIVDEIDAFWGNIPVTTTTKIFPEVLRYKWEAYCNTNGRRTAIQMGGVLTVFPFPKSVGAPKALRYKLEAYCNTNGRCIAILFWEVVVVGVSEILLNFFEDEKMKNKKDQIF